MVITNCSEPVSKPETGLFWVYSLILHLWMLVIEPSDTMLLKYSCGSCSSNCLNQNKPETRNNPGCLYQKLKMNKGNSAQLEYNVRLG